MKAPTAVTSLPMDSVVCFGGEDWWYHNHGHFDMQIMRQLSRRVPVLFVNSIGMRVPSLGRGTAFLTRVQRKLKSVWRGLVAVENNLWVYSPLHVPGEASSLVSLPFLRYQVLWSISRLCFRRPLLWVTVPSAAALLNHLPHIGSVYQRTDYHEAFPGVDRDYIRSLDRILKRVTNVTIFCSRALLMAEAKQCRRVQFIDHGVDFERFAAGGVAADPSDVQAIPRPRVGFIGSIDYPNFDDKLFAAVVARLPDVQFLLVGPSTIPDNWISTTNVHRLGQKRYDEVWRYPGACDVLIIPWKQNTWTRYSNPIKLKEYLSAGRPIVSTPFDELQHYQGLVTVANEADSFAQAIRAGLAAPEDGLAQRQQAQVREETWQRKGEQVLSVIQACIGTRYSEKK